LFDTPYDDAVDAIDSIAAKCALIEALHKRNIPFVSSMGAALKTDASAIRIAKLSKTINCPMARKIRNELKKNGVQMNDIDCVFSAEQCILPENAISPNPNGGRPILGSLPTITAIFGLTIANTIIQRIAKGK
jgi:tRNA A37 threonylcarbamoyladenosine dehydratase